MARILRTGRAASPITDSSQVAHGLDTAGADNGGVTRTRNTLIAALLVTSVGACGHAAKAPQSAGSSASVAPASAPVVPVAAAPAAVVGPAPVVTTPDLTDVDRALAAIDADLGAADRDPSNEGVPAQ